MFPETFVEKHLAATRYNGVVFDPFCGRGTTIFESLIRGRHAAGCDVHPVAVCVSGAKSDPPKSTEVVSRLAQLEEECQSIPTNNIESELTEFFSLCFENSTFQQVLFLRRKLKWEIHRTDRFIAALALGALHGESHRSPNYFSNRMPRTISTKPAYSIRWWKQNGYDPPKRDVFQILKKINEYRFKTPPPKLRGEIELADARKASKKFQHLVGQVSDVITSPPYLDTTNYYEDQWLRNWFLGQTPIVRYDQGDGRHCSLQKYWRFLEEAWGGVAPLLAKQARIVVRIGGRKLNKDETREALERGICNATNRRVHLIDDGVTSVIRRSQSIAFRGSKASTTVEHDFCFQL